MNKILEEISKIEIHEDKETFYLKWDEIYYQSQDYIEFKNYLINTIYLTLHVKNNNLIGKEVIPDVKENISEFSNILSNKDNYRIVERNEIPANIRLKLDAQDLVSLNNIKLPRSRPYLSRGYYVYDGKAWGDVSEEKISIYVNNISFSDSKKYFFNLIEKLDRLQINEWRMKILVDNAEYPRSDSLVIYTDIFHIKSILDIVDQAKGETSFMVKETPLKGVGLAFEVADPRAQYKNCSFGTHRATIFAESILSATWQKLNIEENFEAHCIQAFIDPKNVWRNVDSSYIDLN